VAEAFTIAAEHRHASSSSTLHPMTNTAFDDGVRVQSLIGQTSRFPVADARTIAADCSQQVCRLHGSGSDIADRGCDDDKRK
jgi:hypothetical protein